MEGLGFPGSWHCDIPGSWHCDIPGSIQVTRCGSGSALGRYLSPLDAAFECEGAAEKLQMLGAHFRVGNSSPGELMASGEGDGAAS